MLPPRRRLSLIWAVVLMSSRAWRTWASRTLTFSPPIKSALFSRSAIQRAAVLDWIEALKIWPVADTLEARREHELLLVRSRDVLEHIERVVRHVTRLEHNAETAVQMHFSAQGNRTNNIMRTLTALTAIFLPLNLITGFFGMNFEFLPLIHSSTGFWVALGAMVTVGLGMGAFFWRKRYLGTHQRP